jgi:hypothetical protein
MLPKFLLAAYEDTEHEDKQKRVFEFARHVKAHPTLDRLSAEEAAKLVERELTKTDGTSVELFWETWFPDSDDPRVEFIYCWQRIRFARGEGPLELASRNSRKLPLRPLHEYSRGYASFVSIAGHLQQFQGDQAILLPCERLAKLLSVTAMTITRYRRMALQDGILIIRKKHQFSPGPSAQKNSATEFTFSVCLFDWGTGRQMREGRQPG